jgi:iron complex outermembrane recepter protein
MSLKKSGKTAGLRRALACGTSAMVLALGAVPALAQDKDDDEGAAAAPAQAAAQADADAQGTGGPIVVTGSRIANVGMQAPTPVTSVDADELDVLSPSTLISAVSQLPQFYGNTNNDVRSGFFSSPGAGNLNLRGLNTGAVSIHI